ncbi:MAG: GLPGLI family protein [Flavobacterium sp.]
MKIKFFVMRIFFLSSMLLLLSVSGYSQSAIKVSFETQTKHSETSLKSVPEHIRIAALQQLNSLKKESVMTVQDNIVYYEVKPQEIYKKQNGVISNTSKTSSASFSKDLSLEGSYPSLKVLKNFKTNTIKTKIKDQVTTEKIAAIKWKLTDKKIKILGYTCYEATTTFKNKLLTVYATNDLKFSGSPSDLPFINGLVLSYKHGNSTTTAQKVELKQTLPVNFL